MRAAFTTKISNDKSICKAEQLNTCCHTSLQINAVYQEPENESERNYLCCLFDIKDNNDIKKSSPKQKSPPAKKKKTLPPVPTYTSPLAKVSKPDEEEEEAFLLSSHLHQKLKHL